MELAKKILFFKTLISISLLANTAICQRLNCDFLNSNQILESIKEQSEINEVNFPFDSTEFETKLSILYLEIIINKGLIGTPIEFKIKNDAIFYFYIEEQSPYSDIGISEEHLRDQFFLDSIMKEQQECLQELTLLTRKLFSFDITSEIYFIHLNQNNQYSDNGFLLSIGRPRRDFPITYTSYDLSLITEKLIRDEEYSIQKIHENDRGFKIYTSSTPSADRNWQYCSRKEIEMSWENFSENKKKARFEIYTFIKKKKMVSPWGEEYKIETEEDRLLLDSLIKIIENYE